MTLPQTKTRPESGGSFLFPTAQRRPIFTRERISDEQRLMFETAQAFTRHEVLPHADALERKEPGLMVRLVRQAGALGLLANDVPEGYGGLGGDKVTSLLLAEAVSLYGGWSATVVAHNGIGSLPLVYFGTPEQKERYLPRLVNAEWIGAYALTESGSGSDALAARCRAVPDGDAYVLTGTKQWITNGAWADLYTVFAQLETPDGPRFTAFLVERGWAGVSVGPEAHKLGLHGSSTCDLILDGVRVPRANLLGEIGKGHKIAFNILNVGRAKLGAGSVGGAKELLANALAYAAERRQFGKPIASFGAIRKKVARAAAHLYATEAVCYRVGGLIDERGHGVDAVEEYAVEASILKVLGSETMALVADEMLQLYGGYGFIEEFPPARVYRDSRISRIFEGTNEVNRLLVPGTILKRALLGQLPLMQAYGEAQATSDEPASALDAARRATVLALGLAAGRWMQALADQQEVLEALSDAIIGCFAMESALLRARQAGEERPADAAIHDALARAFVTETQPRLFAALRTVVVHATAAPARGDELQRLERLAQPVGDAIDDAIALREQIAAHLFQHGYRL